MGFLHLVCIVMDSQYKRFVAGKFLKKYLHMATTLRYNQQQVECISRQLKLTQQIQVS